MDSQIDFVPIHGPPSLETQDSQLITEHQKEVREEQAKAAALFPELSNTTPKAKKTMNLGRGSPTAQRHSEDPPAQMPEGPPAQTPAAVKTENESVSETVVKAAPSIPAITTSFVGGCSFPVAGVSASPSINETSNAG